MFVYVSALCVAAGGSQALIAFDWGGKCSVCISLIVHKRTAFFFISVNLGLDFKMS